MPKPVWKKFNNKNDKNNNNKKSRLDELIALPDFPKRNKYKTNMCKSIKENGKCDMGEYCLFAHTEKEVRKPICQYGSRCVIRNCIFEHSEDATLPEIVVRPPSPVEEPVEHQIPSSVYNDTTIIQEMIIELSDDEYDEEDEKAYNECWIRRKFDSETNYDELFEEDYEIYKRMFMETKKEKKHIPKCNKEFFKEINANIYHLEEKFKDYVSRKRSSDEIDEIDMSKLCLNEPAKKKRQIELNCTDKQYEYISNLLKHFK